MLRRALHTAILTLATLSPLAALAQDEPSSVRNPAPLYTTTGAFTVVGLPLTIWNNAQGNRYDDAALDSMTSSSELSGLTLLTTDAAATDPALAIALERPARLLADLTLGHGAALDDLMVALRVAPEHRARVCAALRAHRAQLAPALLAPAEVRQRAFVDALRRLTRT